MSTSLLRRVARSVRASQLRIPGFERFYPKVLHRVPPTAKARLFHLVPQPRDYDTTEYRDVERNGLSLRLRPHHYHQWHHFWGVQDPVLDRLVAEAKRASCILDIGGNIGLYALSMARAQSSGGKLFTFEPNPLTFEWMQESIKRNPNIQLSAVPLALSAAPGRMAMSTHNEGDDLGKFRLSDHGEFEVEVSTVDQFVADHDLAPDLLKIDVEGGEGGVLAGAHSTILTHKPVIVAEVSVPLDTDGVGQRELDWLRSQGYRFSRVDGTPVDVSTLTGYNNIVAEPGE